MWTFEVTLKSWLPLLSGGSEDKNITGVASMKNALCWQTDVPVVHITACAHPYTDTRMMLGSKVDCG